jgi:hypothetical protein
VIGASLKQLEQRYGPSRALGTEPPVVEFTVRGASLEATLFDGFAGRLRVTWPALPELAEPLVLLEELSVIPHWTELPATDPRCAEHFPGIAQARFFAADDGSAVGLVQTGTPEGALVLRLSARNAARQLKAWREARRT